jgi:DNA gyrase/topoisomerase IV subunit A
VISGKNYTFFIASTPGKLRKLVLPAYLLHGVAALAIIGSITVVAAIGSYSRMLWKVGNYNALRHDQENLKKQYRELQTTVKDTNQRLDSLQGLATEVAMTYGVMRYHPAAFDLVDNEASPEDAFDRSIQQYSFLKRNAAAITVSAGGLRLRIRITRLRSGPYSDISPTASANVSTRSQVKARSTLALT